MPKFRKKPVVITAEQFHARVLPWPAGVEESSTVRTFGPREAPDEPIFIVRTLEGPYVVSEGDWIITGIKGERYPCKPDIFTATYEAVE